MQETESPAKGSFSWPHHHFLPPQQTHGDGAGIRLFEIGVRVSAVLNLHTFLDLPPRRFLETKFKHSILIQFESCLKSAYISLKTSPRIDMVQIGLRSELDKKFFCFYRKNQLKNHHKQLTKQG